VAEVTYGSHMAWCKSRALEYVERGDLQNAIASFASDVRKEECTDSLAISMLVVNVGIPLVTANDRVGLRRFIEGFASD
jgi:hypothetical protein